MCVPHACACRLSQKREADFLAAVTGGHELLDAGAGNHTPN